MMMIIKTLGLVLHRVARCVATTTRHGKHA